MGVPKIRAVATSLALVGTATLTATVAAAPAESAGVVASPVEVSISAKRVITMPHTIQPGVNTFKVTTAKLSGSAFQLVQAVPGYTRVEAARDIELGLEGSNVTALKRFERKITLLGGMAVGPRGAGKLVVDLDPGTYWALDTNTTNPAKFLPFKVEGAETGAVAPEPDATLKARLETSWANKPAAIPNKGLLRFQNAASKNHFIVLIKLKKGKTYSDFKEWFAAPAGPSPVNFGVGTDSGALSPGHSATFRYSLPEGHYVLLCFWPDAEMGGIPHAFMGMHRPITLN